MPRFTGGTAPGGPMVWGYEQGIDLFGAHAYTECLSLWLVDAFLDFSLWVGLGFHLLFSAPCKLKKKQKTNALVIQVSKVPTK